MNERPVAAAAVFFLVNEYRPFVQVTGDDRVVSFNVILAAWMMAVITYAIRTVA